MGRRGPWTGDADGRAGAANTTLAAAARAGDGRAIGELMAAYLPLVYTIVRRALAGQRRQVGQAVAWLDPDDRVLWSLWWLEIGEELSRSELAAAFGVSVPHAGVRLQRLRGRLDQARALVAAIEARPRCPWLDTVVAGWDGIPSPLWRKRIARPALRQHGADTRPRRGHDTRRRRCLARKHHARPPG
ncbi:hypothetical protein KZZ52_14330 [Dactylosporangium sp. AC04546]|uniref:hypothetical protein n=1 Tax=Dactylosporangium sp. AC04546 TaxID=2862460 RepID=UPI001EDD467A|nr:hypothetical protein [Dactylosporangium sp. AC04546]WVK86496.1 hypothetical protein KZZ52_14330 [Dactylosporangium sp. AC04546]